MRYKLTTDDFLIFRDGRPFGETGSFGGTSLRWPFAQTLTGMVRSATGLKRSPTYFKDKNNAKKIFEVGIEKLVPSVKMDTGWTHLFPVPADIILTDSPDSADNLTVHPLAYKPLPQNAGTDIHNPEWLIPQVDLSEKPATNPPFFLLWSFFEKYLHGKIDAAESFPFETMGISEPVSDFRIHNALGAKTLVTEEGKLFANMAFYLKTMAKGGYCDLSIDFGVINAEHDDISGDAWLGGERKRVVLEPSGTEFPACPDVFENKRFLRLVLTTHGDFGGWCPSWLKPDLSADGIEWVTIPDTAFKVRLRSACVSGWDGVSGWDYQARGPKPMKKLVCPGAVYVLELQEPSQSKAVAAHLWGNSLCAEKESRYNGYGQCVVGNLHIENQRKRDDQ